MARVIVTGGAGFIGSHIVEALLGDGHEVAVVDNLSSGQKENLPQQASLEVLDIRSPKMRNFLSRGPVDILVHAAAQISVRISMEDPLLDTEINVAGLVNILQSFHGKSYPHIIFLSTGGAIYGEQDIFPAPESHPTKPSSVYGLAKKVSEMYLEFWARELGLKFCALRLSNVYGPRQNPHGEAGVVAIFIEKLLRKEVPTINGSGEQTRDFVFVKDVADAVLKVSQQKTEGIYNIGTGREASVNEIYRAISSALDSDTAPHYGPAKPGEQMRSSIDSGLARHTFSWEPRVSLEEGIQETAGWFGNSKAGQL